MKLPSPIETYFEADGKADGAAPMSAFAKDAVVEDEGKTYRGSDAIGKWWRAAKAKTEHTAEPFAIEQKGDVTEVQAKVAGNFPGSPANLTFAFRLADDAITRLRIGV
ncbi:MAG: nuclear transport factor 2 family protein [Acuticoccus sp.]